MGNLVLQKHSLSPSNQDAILLVRNLLTIFSDVELLVLANQFHGAAENAEELVWLRGSMEDVLEADSKKVNGCTITDLSNFHGSLPVLELSGHRQNSV